MRGTFKAFDKYNFVAGVSDMEPLLVGLDAVSSQPACQCLMVREVGAGGVLGFKVCRDCGCGFSVYGKVGLTTQGRRWERLPQVL